MKPYKIAVALIILASIFLTACNRSDNDGTTTNSARQELNIAYGTHPRQVMDVYFPTGYNTSTPVVFIFHGGGFAAGNKNDFSVYAQLFRDQGFVTINASYRLVDTIGILQTPIIHKKSDVKFTDIMEDADAAINKYISMSPAWKSGTDKMYMTGHSAGAILSMVYSHSEKNLDKHIKACGNWAGVTDLTIPHDSLLKDIDDRYKELMYRIAGVEMKTSNNLAFMYMSAYWQANKNGGIPAISVYPVDDTTQMSGADSYNLHNTRNFHTLLTNKNVGNKLHIYNGSDHGFSKPSGAWQKVIKETADFFKAN